MAMKVKLPFKFKFTVQYIYSIKELSSVNNQTKTFHSEKTACELSTTVYLDFRI